MDTWVPESTVTPLPLDAEHPDVCFNILRFFFPVLLLAKAPNPKSEMAERLY
jgi:hypothetical protein